MLNFGNQKETIDFHNMPKEYKPLRHFPKTGEIVIDTLESQQASRVKEITQLNNVVVLPKQALIIKFY